MIEYSADEWLPVLRRAYRFLISRGVGDLALYGSQSLSAFLGELLSSKNIDFVGTLTLAQLAELSRYLRREERFEVRRRGSCLIMTVYAETPSGKPIAIEIFSETPLGPIREFMDEVREVEIKGEKYWAVTPTLYLACKLIQPLPLTSRDVENMRRCVEVADLKRTIGILRRKGRIEEALRKVEESLKRGLKIEEKIVEELRSSLS